MLHVWRAVCSFVRLCLPDVMAGPGMHGGRKERGDVTGIVTIVLIRVDKAIAVFLVMPCILPCWAVMAGQPLPLPGLKRAFRTR